MNKKTSQSEISKYAHEIVEAAAQRLRFAHVEDDVDFRGKGGHVVYAVDPDIAKLFLNPINKAHYAKVFSHQTDESCRPVAWHLGKFIFFALTDNRLCLISPHWEEFVGVIDGIERNALKVPDILAKAARKAERLVLECSKDINSPEIVADRLLAEVPELILFLVGQDESAASELRNATQLFDKDRICSDRDYFEEMDAEVETLYWSFAEIPSLYDMARDNNPEFHKVAHQWFTRLREVKSKKRSAHRIQRDAEVLAYLQLANLELANENRRVVLISGDESMLLCASRVDDYGKPLKDPGATSFADRYLRDVRGYMSTRKKDADSDRDELRDSLDALFSLFGGAERENPSAYRRYLGALRRVSQLSDEAKKEDLALVIKNQATLAKDSPEAGVVQGAVGHKQIGFDQLRTTWLNYVEGLHIPDAIKYYKNESVDNRGKFLIDESVKEAIDAIVHNQDVYQLLDEHISKTWLDFFLAASRTGFFWYVQNSKSYSPRAVPTVRFDYVERARSVADFITRTLMAGEIEDWRSISTDIQKRDSSRYTQCLLLGVAHAAMGRWKISDRLAQQAIRIAIRIEKKRRRSQPLTEYEERIYGHEAWYLRIHALRHEAKSIKDIDRIEHYLHMRVEPRHALYAKAFGQPLRDLRFEHDRLTLQIMRLHFMVFVDGAELTAGYGDLVDGIEKCRLGFNKILDELDNGLEKIEIIRETLIRRALINVLQTEFMLSKVKGSMPVADNRLERLASRLDSVVRNREKYYMEVMKNKNNVEYHPDLSVTYLVRLVSNISTMFFSSEGRKIEQAHSLLVDSLLTSERIENHCIMPYDRGRFMYFKDLVDKFDLSRDAG